MSRDSSPVKSQDSDSYDETGINICSDFNFFSVFYFCAFCCNFFLFFLFKGVFVGDMLHSVAKMSMRDQTKERPKTCTSDLIALF